MNRIMFATDFAPCTVAAEREAVRLAHALGAELLLAHVASDTPRLGRVRYTPEVRAVFESGHKWAANALAKRASTLGADGLMVRSVVRVGEASDEAERVIRSSPCPVLTVRPDVDIKE